MPADKIVPFLLKREFRSGQSRVELLQSIELVYRSRGPYVVDKVIVEFMRYAKDVEQVSEMDMLAAIHRHCFEEGEPLCFPLGKPDFIRAWDGTMIWERPKT